MHLRLTFLRMKVTFLGQAQSSFFVFRLRNARVSRCCVSPIYQIYQKHVVFKMHMARGLIQGWCIFPWHLVSVKIYINYITFCDTLWLLRVVQELGFVNNHPNWGTDGGFGVKRLKESSWLSHMLYRICPCTRRCTRHTCRQELQTQYGAFVSEPCSAVWSQCSATGHKALGNFRRGEGAGSLHRSRSNMTKTCLQDFIATSPNAVNLRFK